MKLYSYNRRKIYFTCIAIVMTAVFLMGRLAYLMVAKADYYNRAATGLHERERSIKAPRGRIYDRNGNILADNKAVCSVSVIHSQIEDEEAVIQVLNEYLDKGESEIRKKVTKVSSRELIATNVAKETGDQIRELNVAGIKVDEDYKRYYPYSSLASKVLGFTGADNQGIIGLEIKYDKYLKGTDGLILTPTDSRGVEQEKALEQRVEPVSGNSLTTSIDVNIQKYSEQIAYNALKAKQANYVSIIVMNPNNGEILAMVNAPEFDLNNPYKLIYETDNNISAKEKQKLLNKMWRNANVSDTYEPGSTFKTVTAAAALEAGVVTFNDTFSCPGFYIVEDRRIRCHKVSGHGSETFLQGIQNSCNPVFIQVGLRLGAERFYSYFEQFELLEKTGIDLPGEARTIMHDPKKIGEVELATISFGQSFQLTTLRLLTTISSFVNGGHTVVPHFGMAISSFDGTSTQKIAYPQGTHVLDEAVSAQMRECLESVVAEGGGNKAYIEGYRIGGKTATSEKLPRGTGKYISSFVGFAPADEPQVIIIMTVDEPQGIYYGGTIVAPKVKKIFENILPYLNV